MGATENAGFTTETWPFCNKTAQITAKTSNSLQLSASDMLTHVNFTTFDMDTNSRSTNMHDEKLTIIKRATKHFFIFLPFSLFSIYFPLLFPSFLVGMCSVLSKLVFYYRAMLCIRGTCHGSVSVSVCLSGTSRSFTKTAKRRLTQITPHDTPVTIVF